MFIKHIYNFLNLIRFHQWLKNLLIFVPLLLSSQKFEYQSLINLIVAFVLFSLCASGMYILNDIKDLQSDKLHPHNKKRAIAAGKIKPSFAIIVSLLLLISSLSIASFQGLGIFNALLTYALLNILYTLFLKKLFLLDCVFLSIFYSLRMVAGGLVINELPSFWLLLFSGFIFLSLAFAKRLQEIKIISDKSLYFDQRNLDHRAYKKEDEAFLQISGISSGYVSILVLGLYLNSQKAIELYNNPEFIWIMLVLVWLWLNLIWFFTSRGKLSYDPVVFAFSNKLSILLITTSLLSYLISRGII